MPAPDLVVLFQDRDMLVVDKPAGLHTAPLRREETDTLLTRVIAMFPEVAALPGVKPVEPGLVHRLDQETSGLVVVARTAEAFRMLRRTFISGSSCKEYCAVCGGGETDRSTVGTTRIESRFAPFGPGRKRVRVVLPADGKKGGARQAAREMYATEADILFRAAGRVLLSARIFRGFRHQVRAHLSFLGYPILGDPLYGVPVPPGLAPRMYLHASRLEMPHPRSGAPLVVRSPVPAEFGAAFPDYHGKELTP
jgi:23S rRNA pseudouridine1911/1915/1917 synthase